MYCEPFAGMLGVLLQRRPAALEIANDLDGRVVNWWRVVRDQPAELERILAATPYSRAEHSQAVETVADADADTLRRAWAFTVLCEQGQAVSGNSWGGLRSGAGPPSFCTAWARVGGLARRIQNVELECVDAVDLIDSLSGNEDAVIYADPPYPDTLGYEVGVDIDRFVAAVLNAQGRVAVSGWADSFPELTAAGWDVHTLERKVNMVAKRGTTAVVECVWTNYAIAQSALF